MLEQDSGAHFTSQNSTDLHFGLGAHAIADVRIVWPDGFAQTIKGVAANRHVVLREQRDPVPDPIPDPAIEGTAGADNLTGTNGADRIRGNDGNDTLVGRGGADRLEGGAGDDKLFGGDGDDFLAGALGKDFMTGQAGADTFAFTAPGETRTGARRDVVKDFQVSVDTLDLSEIDANAALSGNQAFAFIGSGAFGREAGQLRFAAGVVEGDVNGDGRVDFQIELRSLAALMVEDILL